MLKKINIQHCIVVLMASAFLAFGLYNVHSVSGVTEGGILGMSLLLQHWLDISPSISGFVMNSICYVMGWKILGKMFIFYSILSTIGFSVSYRIFEQFEPLWPNLYQYPFAAAILGAIFVGIGAGGCVRIGGAPSGDDALAMSISHVTGLKIQWIYLISDLIVLVLSISYIPIQRIGFSLLTVIISGQIIGLINKTGTGSATRS